tara:strand:+ start:291 stop:485 length:195 start_codon:yes stop_codon:yes gene_type:complete
MDNGLIIADFLLDKGVSRNKLSKLLEKDRRHLYNLIIGKYVISEEDKEKLNEIFKSYNYGKRIK